MRMHNLHQVIGDVVVDVREHLFPVGLLGFLRIGECLHDLALSKDKIAGRLTNTHSNISEAFF